MWVEETDGIVIDHGSGAGSGNVGRPGEADDAVPKKGIADESDVAKRCEGREFECEVLLCEHCCRIKEAQEKEKKQGAC